MRSAFVPQLPIRFPELAEEMARQGVSNFEMEASALLVLAGLAGCRAGVVCTAYAQRVRGVFADDDQRRSGESACIETGLEALRLLADMDEAVRKSGSVHWRPSLWPSVVAS
jgi:uridine phosphorylase